MNHIETMKQALDALEQVSSEMTVGLRYTNAGQSVLDALPALCAAIAQLSLSVGDSHFEEWYQSYERQGISKQVARDAYAAGMGDPLVAIAQPESEPIEIEWPDYSNEGMGCGLEDRGITNRYEAMRYGWDQAIDRVAEMLPDPLYTAPVGYVPLTDEQIIEIRKTSFGGRFGKPSMCQWGDSIAFARAIERAARGDKP